VTLPGVGRLRRGIEQVRIPVASTLAHLGVAIGYPMIACRLPSSGAAPSPLRIT
jgi:hypothetical protein